MTIDAKTFYDRYWTARDRERTEARSRERAVVAAALLAKAGLRGGRLLDAGCGPGWALEELARAGFDAMGADVSSVAVEEARRRGLDARLIDIESRAPEEVLREAGGPFDAVVLLEVLEHLADPLSSLEKAKRLLREGGLLAVSLPNEIALPARLALLFGRLPFGGHDDPHVRHFDRRQARRLLAAAGLEPVGERPVGIVPPSRRLLRLAAAPAVLAAPGCFAIATVFVLRPIPVRT